MIKNNKISLFLSSVLILLPLILHFVIEGFLSGMIFMPPFLLVMHWLCIMTTAYDNKSNSQSPKIFNIILWILPTISITTSLSAYLLELEVINDPHMILYIIIGVLFIAVGNYMPKTRQNCTIGIKIKWTLQSEANWNATHRIAGFVWLVLGGIIIVSAFLPANICIPVFIVSVLISVIIPYIYSYRFYKKELSEDVEFKTVKFSGISKKSSVIVAIAVVIIILAVCFTGEITCTIENESITVDSIWWSETEIKFSDINSANLIENCDFGTRTSGVGTPRLSIGSFRNKVYNSYSLYAYTKNHTAVELSVGGKIILINAKSHDETVKLFEIISERIK